MANTTKLFGKYTAAATLRWMGANGWTADDAVAALDRMGATIKRSTVVAGLYDGRKGLGKPAPVTPAEAAELVNGSRTTVDVYIKTEWAGISSYSEDQINELCRALAPLGAHVWGGDKGLEVEVKDEATARKVIATARRMGFDTAYIEE